MRIASIDIGTNTVLLTVAEWNGSKLKILRDEARITRLGQGLNRDPHFLPEAQERTLAVLKDYKTIAQDLGAEEILAVGTAAFRRAENADSFVRRVHDEAGIDLRIISGEEEAHLSYLSAVHDFGDTENLFALDIGGGSTEIISRDSAVSLPLGAVTLSESMVRHDPIADHEFEAMEKEIRRVVGTVSPPVRHGGTTPTLIGLAGSVTTLSAIRQGLKTWDGAKVQGSKLTLSEIEDQITLFRRTTHAEKSNIAGMVKGREDTILAGALILGTVMKTLGVDRVTVSDRGLRFALIYEGTAG